MKLPEISMEESCPSGPPFPGGMNGGCTSNFRLNTLQYCVLGDVMLDAVTYGKECSLYISSTQYEEESESICPEAQTRGC